MHSVPEGQTDDPSFRRRKVIRAAVVSIVVAVAVAVLVTLFLTRGSRSHDTPDSTLATVGKTTISLASLDSRLSDLQLRIGIPDNGDTRKELLRGMVNDRLLLLEARAKGLDRDTEGKAQRSLIEQRVLIDEYVRRHVLPGIATSEGELKTLFVRLNTKVEARHLFAQTFAQAQAYRERLLHGESFDSLAKEAFTDPELRDNGGRLKPFSVDEMDPAFEKAAYELPIDSISEPVKLKHGYSVLQVLKRTRRPLLTEQEFIEKRQDLENFLRARKRPEAFQRYADSLRTDVIQLHFDPTQLEALYGEFQDARGSEGPLPQVLRSRLNRQRSSEDLARGSRGPITVADGVELLSEVTPSELDWVRSEEDFENLLAGVLVRHWLLTAGRRERLDRSDDYAARVSDQFETYLIQRMSDSAVTSYAVPADTLRAFYDRNKSLFHRADAIRLNGIQVPDAKTASEVAGLLGNGASFSDLALRYSVHAASAARGGELGIFTKAELGGAVSRVWELQPGEWLGPVEMDGGGYGFFQVAERLSGKTAAFERIRPDVMREYRKLNRQQILSEHTDRLRKGTVVKINEALLFAPRDGGERAL